MEAFGIELEVMDKGFHRVLHFGAARRRDLVVGGQHLTADNIQLFKALLHDLHRLAHFLDAAQIAVPAVAVLAQRHIELELGIAFVGLRLAQVPGDARAAQHHAGKAPVEGLFPGDDADIDIALLEDAVFGDQSLDVVQCRDEFAAPHLHVLDQLRRQVLVDAARAKIVGVQTRPAGALVEHHQLFAFLEAPQRRRKRPDVHGLGGDVEDVRQDAADFREDDADQLRALGHIDAQQLLDGQYEGVLLVHRRNVVEAVEIGHVLQIGACLHQLFRAAVQQADMRIDALDDFTVKVEHQAQNAVRRRVLRPEIDRETTIIHMLWRCRYVVSHVNHRGSNSLFVGIRLALAHQRNEQAEGQG